MTSGMCHAFKVDLLKRLHGDTFKIALYRSIATLSISTPSYTDLGEVESIGGYKAGGVTLKDLVIGEHGETASLDWSDPVWPTATIRARAALIYNASRGNVAVAVLVFKEDIASTNAPFTVKFPHPTAALALVRIGA